MCPDDKYRLIIDGAKFADRNNFEAIWTPERHFHRFGGLYPNPSVLTASLSTITERLGLRAGSVVLPIHNPVRVAEEWAVVDNLSKGRVAIAIASGFHPNDFVFSPDGFSDRRETKWERIEVVKKLWRGEKITLPDGMGKDVQIELFPRPVQKELPLWITCGNAVETFEKAGAMGANVLTALIGIPLDQMSDRIAVYRKSLSENGFDAQAGRVTLMLHTYIDDDTGTAIEKVREPFSNYLRSHTQLLTSLAKSKNANFDAGSIAEEDFEDLLSLEFDRYFHTASLMGTIESCNEMVQRIKQAGIDEIGCLIDFGVDIESAMASLSRLNELRQQVIRDARSIREPEWASR